MMGLKLLFVHNNLPGQFRELAPALALREDLEVHTLGEHRPGKRFNPPGVTDHWYPPAQGAGKRTHPFVRSFEASVRRGQAAYRALRKLRQGGFVPDVVVAHPGWGETLFLKDVFPEARLICFWEFYYRGTGADVGFDPEFPPSLDTLCRPRVTNATQLCAFDSCDWGVSPTRWQVELFPEFIRKRSSRIFEGVRTDVARPDPGAAFQVPGGPTLTRSDEVLTYVARNLEPYRGFHSFMRALPEILARRPDCRVLVVGGDEVSYGRRLPPGQSYRKHYLEETGLDSDRVHFLGRIPYAQYLKVLQVSSVHLYLTYPFVLSWSFLEAMSAGCLVLGSATGPVLEVLRPGVNGLLVEDMLDPACVAEAAVRALAERREHEGLREAARRTIVEHYDFRGAGLPAWEKLIREQAALR